MVVLRNPLAPMLRRHAVKSSSGSFRLAARAPVLPRQRPTLVIAPPPNDLEIPRGKTPAREAERTHESDRAPIFRLDVRLESMKTILVERERDHGREAGAHVTADVMGHERVVAEIARAERAHHDLGNVDDTREL